MSNKPIFARTAVVLIGLMLAAAIFAPAQQAGPQGKTAGQQYKNVQVLKDVPAAQFIPSMRFLAAALGVECEYCHMGNRSVDTPNKQTARKMMTMMLALNKQSFGGQLEITCYTCHKGTHPPVSAPVPTGEYSVEGPTAFYRPTAPPIGATDEPMSEAYQEEMKKQQAARAALPKADEILAKYVTALGGEQALRKVTSRVITATVELSPNVRGAGPTVHVRETQYFQAPNLYMATLQGFSGPQTAKGFDGADAWTQNPNGSVAQAGGSDLTRAKRAADFYESINLKQEYTRLDMTGIEKVRDRDVYVVVGVPAGDNPERLFFDTQTGLLLRKGTYDMTALGPYTMQTDYDDYRDVGGVKVPFLISTTSVSPADTAVIHVEKVDNNPSIDAAKFTRPASKPPAAR